MRKKEIFTAIGFGCAIASLTLVIIQALSLLMVAMAIIFSIWGLGTGSKAMNWAALAMAALAFILDIVYLIVVLAGRA